MWLSHLRTLGCQHVSILRRLILLCGFYRGDSHSQQCVMLCLYIHFTLTFCICSTMIDINQWRASIGSFYISTKRSASYTYDTIRYDCLEFMEYEVSCIYHYFPIVWFISVYYVLNVFFQMSLLLSGDVETNPGPVKTCPSCDAEIHIRKKICICGYVFNQRYHLPKLTPVL